MRMPQLLSTLRAFARGSLCLAGMTSMAFAAAPEIHNVPVVTAEVGTPYQYALGATDADGDALNYSVSVWPQASGLTISTQGVISWQPTQRDQAGRYTITAYVQDDTAERTSLRYTLAVTDPSNRFPVIANAPVTTATVGSPYTYDLGATDADGDSLTYWASIWPTGSGITLSDQGVIQWHPQTADEAGQYHITAYVDDGHLGREVLHYTLTVTNPSNQFPVITNAPVTTATVGSPYTYDLGATDADGDSLTYWASVWPPQPGITVTDQGVVQWHPQAADDAGQYHITAYVDDGNLGRELVHYTLSVTNHQNRAPTIANTPAATATVGEPYAYALGAADADGDTLSYWVSVWPGGSGMTVSDQGVVQWQPQVQHDGIAYTVTAYVDDGNLGQDTIRYTVTANKPVEFDSDGDGVIDDLDAFPQDPLQTTDVDGDGVGDNTVQQQRTTYSYNDDGQVATINGPRTDVEDVTQYHYHPQTRYLEARIDGAGNRVSFSQHNGRGQPLDVIDANGTVTHLTYHVRGWLLSSSVAHPSGDPALASTTTYTYDPVGNLTTITRPDGIRLEYHYDTSHRLIGVSNLAGERIDYTLDNAGNRLSQTIQDGSSTLTYQMTQVYDELSRVMEMIGADNQVTQYDYDTNNNAVQAINPRQYATQFSYDPLNRLIRTTDPDSGTTHYRYDAHDRLTSVTDANGHTATYTYDAFGHVIAQDSPDTGTTRMAYDNAGNRVVEVDSRGVVTHYRYDALNRLTHVEYPSAPEHNIVYRYDVSTYQEDGGPEYTANALGRLFSIDDNSGQTFFLYDHLGNIASQVRRLHGESTPIVYWTDYRYDLASKLIEVQMFANGEALKYATRYQYDTLGRVTGMDYHRQSGSPYQPLVSGIRYLPFGPVTEWTHGNNTLTQLSYDQDYRLTQQHIQSDTRSLLQRHYTYDANGNMTQREALQAADDRAYQYDALDRLLDSTSPAGTTAWQYDLVGNRLTESTNNNSTTTNSTDTYSYQSGSNGLLDIQRNAVDTLYTLDQRGNTTHISHTAQGGTTTVWAYNAANRPERVTHPDGSTTEYRYNALGQRTHKTHQGTTTHYLYNLQGQLMGEYTATGQPIVEYVYLNQQPLIQIRNGNLYYYHNDHLGTPKTITDQNQNVVWDANYTAFGKANVTTETIENNLRGIGQYYDEETSLHYVWHRYLDPELGRFTQSDPIGLDDGPNTYAYVANNPLVYFDPNGLSKSGRLPASPTPSWARPLSKVGGSLVRQIQRYDSSFTYQTVSSNGVRFTKRDIRRLEEILNRNEQSGVCPSPLNLTPLGAGRRGAFREAKRGEGIPVSQNPTLVRPNYDRNGNIQLGREYIFGQGSNKRSIREDAAGHFFGSGNNQNRGSHFNGSNNTHYDY